LSRACLGEKNVFVQKRLQEGVFSRTEALDELSIDCYLRQRISFLSFPYVTMVLSSLSWKNDRFYVQMAHKRRFFDLIGPALCDSEQQLQRREQPPAQHPFFFECFPYVCLS
jgi:hypothetical protein